MKFFCFLAITAYLAGSAFAKPVSQGEAENIAVGLAKTKKYAVTLKTKKLRKSQPATARMGMAAAEENALYYVFDIGDNNGFAIIAGDDVFKPVLGFSENGKFDHADMPPSFAWYLQNIEDEMAFALERGQEQTPQLAQEWIAFAAGSLYTPGAYLLTTRWDQSAPYNGKTPVINGTAALTGCVATTMSQIMNYHKYPAKGRGTIPAYLTRTRKIDIPAVNMETVTFNWTNMTNDAMATLMSVTGKSVEMDYDINGSGASSKDAVVALRGYFNYDPAIQYIERDNAGNGWENILREQIDLSLPVYYSGTGSGGHAFVLDGYDNSGRFHFNWGWGGLYDGWFVSTALTPGTSNYNYSQGAIINIMPNKGQSVPNNYDLKFDYAFIYDAQDNYISNREIFQDSAVRISSQFRNYGASEFFGRIVIMLENEFDIQTISEKYVHIPANNGYANANFYTPKINLAGGNYQIQAFYITDDGQYHPMPATYSLGVSVIGLYMPKLEISGSVAPELEGYTSVDSLNAVLSNIGQKNLTNLSFYFKKGFFASKSINIASTIFPGNSSSFKFAPVLGLAPGTYKDTLIVTGNNNVSLSYPLELKVVPISEYYSAFFDADSLVFAKTYFSYGAEETKKANFNNVGILTGLKAAFSKGMAFELVAAFPSQLPMSSSTPVSIRTKSGLAPGVYKDTLFITGNNSISLKLPLKAEIAKMNVVSEQNDYNLRLGRPISLLKATGDTIHDNVIYQDSALNVRISIQNIGTDDFAGKVIVVMENKLGMEIIGQRDFSVPASSEYTYSFTLNFPKIKSPGGNYKIRALYSIGTENYYMVSSVKYTTFDCINPIDVFVVGLYMPKLEISGSVANLPVNYSSVDSLNMTLSNVGQKTLANLSLHFKHGYFSSNNNVNSTILPGNSSSLKFAPVLGLKAGIYKDTMIVTGDNDVYVAFPLEFVVGTSRIAKQNTMLTEISQDAIVQIYDLKGKLMAGALPPGLYIVKIKLPGKPHVFFRHVQVPNSAAPLRF